MMFRHFPAVTFFKAGTMMVFHGDVMETEAVIDFLTNEEALELPDKIEAVDDENLFRLVDKPDTNRWIHSSRDKSTLNILTEYSRKRSMLLSCSTRRRKETA